MEKRNQYNIRLQALKTWEWLGIECFQEIYHCFPHDHLFYQIKGKKLAHYMLEKKLYEQIVFSRYYNSGKSKQKLEQIIFKLKDNVLVNIIASGNRQFVTLYYHPSITGKQELKNTVDFIGGEEFRKKIKKKEDGKFRILVRDSHNYYFKAVKPKKIDLELEQNYNEDLLPMHDNLVKKLSDKKGKGLVIFHGPPGCGKTYYLRYLIHHLSKPKLFIPSIFADHLASPEFIDFIMPYKDSILIIEDAEDAMRNRKQGRNSAVSNILNLCDGLLSDAFSLQLIATFNCPLTDLDPALLRKGRLLASYKFAPLELEKARALASAKGLDPALITGPTSLANIFNYEEESFDAEEVKIGF